MERALKIKTPHMPDVFQYEMPPGRREDGFQPYPQIPIEDFTEEEAVEFAEMMKQEFIKHWRNKKIKSSV